ncbi:carbohydrate porin [Endozoicomonas arenosclerae]|uniref:carbohydrate porin n=1 Tax=Endozoicomonas arenosclerae TaxID=1633495 RepID=UPI000780AC06|nr:carbohydrate porin [Endozoicomonas arenosclerae]
MKKSLIASAILLASAATGANAAWTSPDGALTIGGDIEINTDAVDVSNGSQRPETKTIDEGVGIGDDSRFKLDVEWNTKLENGEYIKAKAQPLIRTDGTMAIDDSFVALGVQDSWEFQIGRFEAMELFSVGKDTAFFVAAGGDVIGQGVYYYKGHEARGRRDGMGQARVATQAGNWTMELSSAYGDAADMLAGSEDYLKEHGFNTDTTFKSDDSSFVVRPAVNYTSDSGFFSLSFGAEYDASNGDVKITSTNESTGAVMTSQDLSKRMGASVKSEFKFSEDLAVRLSAAHQTIKDVWTVSHVNANFEYKRFGMGLSVVGNELDQTGTEDISSYTAYAAYTMPIMSFDNATVTFAASYSETDNAFGIKDNNEEVAAVRARINYYF